MQLQDGQIVVEKKRTDYAVQHLSVSVLVAD